MRDKPTFAIHYPSFFGITDDEERARVDAFREEDRKGPGFKINQFYVDGALERKLGFDLCSFVAGEFKDVPIQQASIYDVDGVLHDAVIVLHHNKKNYNIRGFLVEPGDEETALKYLQSEPNLI